jgi:hypothetical protein
MWMKHRVDRIPGTSCITNKAKLWQSLGRSDQSHITPHTYILPQDYEMMKKQGPYIYKTLSHRQEGLHVAHRLPLDLIRQEKFALAQDFLLNTLTYQGYKVTLRMYMMIRYRNRRLNYYTIDDGMTYYSRNKYNPHNRDIYSKIASFYDCKHHYDRGFPLTLEKFLKEYKGDSHRLLRAMKAQIKTLTNILTRNIDTDKLWNDQYQLLGIDFHVLRNGTPLILEVNSGPGMTPHNREDALMRNKITSLGLKRR